MATFGAECRWWMGGNCWILRRPKSSRAGRQHGIADRLGDHGTARRRRHAQRMRDPRHGISTAYPKERWIMGRALLHRNWLSARLLSYVPLVSRIFPADRADHLFEGDGGEEYDLVLGSWFSVLRGT